MGTELEAAHEDGIRRLKRALARSPRGLLCFAVGRDEAIRARVAARIGARVVQLDREDRKPWRALVEVDGPVIGLVPAGEVDELFARLNLGREIKTVQRRIVVLWLQELSQLDTVRVHAPDLWAHRRELYWFLSGVDFRGEVESSVAEEAARELAAVEAELAELGPGEVERRFDLLLSRRFWLVELGRDGEARRVQRQAKALLANRPEGAVHEIMDAELRLSDLIVHLEEHPLPFRLAEAADLARNAPLQDQRARAQVQASGISHELGRVEQTLQLGQGIVDDASVPNAYARFLAAYNLAVMSARAEVPGRIPGAAEHGQLVDALEPKLRRGALQRLRLLAALKAEQLGRSTEALAEAGAVLDYTDATGLVHDLGLARLLAANRLAQLGLDRAALSLVEDPRHSPRPDAESAHQAVAIARALGDEDRARSLCESWSAALLAHHRRPTALRHVARLHAVLEDHDTQRAALLEASARGHSEEQTRARLALAELDNDQDRPSQALAAVEPALRWCRLHCGPAWTCRALALRSRALRGLGQHDRATADLDEADALLAELPSDLQPMETILLLARARRDHLLPGDDAATPIHSALARARSRGLRLRELELVLDLAEQPHAHSLRLAGAQAALALATELGFPVDLARADLALAELALDEGDPARARTHGHRAAWWLSRIGPPKHRRRLATFETHLAEFTPAAPGIP